MIICIKTILFFGIWMDKIMEIFVNECMEYTNTANKLIVSLTSDSSLNWSLFFFPYQTSHSLGTVLFGTRDGSLMDGPLLFFAFSSKGKKWHVLLLALCYALLNLASPMYMVLVKYVHLIRY